MTDDSAMCDSCLLTNFVYRKFDHPLAEAGAGLAEMMRRKPWKFPGDHC